MRDKADAVFRGYIEEVIKSLLNTDLLLGQYVVTVAKVIGSQVDPMFSFLSVYKGDGRTPAQTEGKSILYTIAIRHTLGETGNYFTSTGWLKTGDRVEITLSIL